MREAASYLSANRERTAARNGANGFNWNDDRWDTLIKGVTKKYRVVRRVLPLFGDSGRYVETVPINTFAAPRPGALASQPGQPLVPVEISIELDLSAAQFDDYQVTLGLVTRAATLLARAEDEVLVRGAQANLTNLGVLAQNLGAQDPALMTNLPPAPIRQPILDSILAGITTLQTNNHHGEYCVIVAPDLYQEAFRPGAAAADAPIHQIRPRLRQEHGFLYTPALPPGHGVIMSLGGHTLDIAVPMDATLEFVEEQRGRATLRVFEQFRLRVISLNARISLA